MQKRERGWKIIIYQCVSDLVEKNNQTKVEETCLLCIPNPNQKIINIKQKQSQIGEDFPR